MRRIVTTATAVVALAAPAQAGAHLLKGLPLIGDALSPAAPASTGPGAIGRFSDPFVEPAIGGQVTDAKCITDGAGVQVCKPAAGSVTVMPNGKVLYWNALEGTEEIDVSIVAEYGAVARNDQTRVLDLSGDEPAWSVPDPVDAGAVADGNEAIVPDPGDEPFNNGALFCSDLTYLPDGRVLAVGGTNYYMEPRLPGTKFGISELEGLRNARVYDPATNRWSQVGSMRDGRWYPTLVSLGSGETLVASGVTKLLKPVYPDAPLDSGLNVKRMERFSPQTLEWTDEGPGGERSLPLYPRLHLLPNGHVFYNAAGQAFNPFGQAYDELYWNVAGAYDPAARRWTDLGIPGLEGRALADLATFDFGDPVGDLGNLGIPGGGKSFTQPGFRGSTFSVMLPLRPPYTSASFLTAGGVLNPPSPGSYFATSDSRITTVDVSSGQPRMTTRGAGDMSRPRWYPTGIALPTGEVVAVSGSDRDVVAGPGVEFPIKQAELFDPATETWKPLAEANRPRTYHNSAALLHDGRILVGGHAPISTLYLRNTTLPGGFAPNDGRDPSFELYSPPYLFRGERPVIRQVTDSAPAHGAQIDAAVTGPSPATRFVLVRNHTTTHVIDADQRTVQLVSQRIGATGYRLTIPANRNVLPPGPYMLFAIRDTAAGPVPSVAHQMFVR